MAFIETQVADTFVIKMRSTKPLVDLVPYASKFWKWFGRVAEVETTTNNDLKIPVRVGDGAAISYGDFDQGSVGEGGAPAFKTMLSRPKQIQAVSQLSLAGMKHTDTQEKAATSLFSYAVADHARRIGSTFDSLLLAPAGIFATVTTGTTGTSLVVSDIRHFHEGMPLSRYSSDFLTQRTSASGKAPRVTAIARLTKTITLNEGFTGGAPATSDVLLLGGLSGPSPTKLASIYDFHENAATGSVGGLSRVTYDQLRSSKASAGSMLNVVHGYAALYALATKRPESDLAKSAIWLGSAGTFAGNVLDVTQRTQITFSGRQDERSGARAPSDYSFDITADGTFVGIPTMICAHAKDDRAELLLKKNWGKQVTIAPQPMDFGGAGQMFPVIDSVSFTPKFQYLFGNIAELQVYCLDTGAETYIDNVALPAGWSALA